MAGGGEERAVFQALKRDAQEALPKIAHKNAELVDSAAEKGSQNLAAHAENEARLAESFRSKMPPDKPVPSPRAESPAAGPAAPASAAPESAVRGTRIDQALARDNGRAAAAADAAKPQFGNEALRDSPNFNEQIDRELNARGLDRAEHDRLRVTRTNDLTDGQIQQVVDVRNSIRIQDGQVITKVIPANIKDGYLGNDRSLFDNKFDPTRFSGSIARGTDTADLVTPARMRDGLALDDKGLGWSPVPEGAPEAHQLRFRAPEDLPAETTFGAVDDPVLANHVAEMAGQSTGRPWADPFTGTGYTGGGVPEWNVKTPTEFAGRAEIWRVSADGQERMLGFYRNGRWNRVDG